MSVTQSIVVPGLFTVATLPPAPSEDMHVAWVSDWPGVGRALVMSTSIKWVLATGFRTEDYSGTTDGSGNYTVTYAAPFVSTPNVQPVIVNATDQQFFKLTATSVTGFTMQVRERASLTVLGINLLSFATTPVSGASARVLVVGN